MCSAMADVRQRNVAHCFSTVRDVFATPVRAACNMKWHMFCPRKRWLGCRLAFPIVVVRRHHTQQAVLNDTSKSRVALISGVDLPAADRLYGVDHATSPPATNDSYALPEVTNQVLSSESVGASRNYSASGHPKQLFVGSLESGVTATIERI